MSINGAQKRGMPTNAADPLDETQAPAVITDLHVRDRATSKAAGSPLAWRKRSQIQMAFDQERFGARDSQDALRRFDAGTFYTKLYDASQMAWRDSTAGFESTGSGDRMPYGEAQGIALARLAAIERHLGKNDLTIGRAVCWYGYSPAEAIRRARLPDDTRISARLCECLDALADAIERTAKSKNPAKHGA